MAKRKGIVAEVLLFLKANKAYWMAPIFIVLLLVMAFVILGATSAAPFIYTLF